MMRPRVSVIIPVHNGSRDLAFCLQALSSGVERPHECIVVDDCSTDESVEIAQRFGARVVRCSKRSGPATARNAGVRAAEGDILLFLDADVVVSTETVGRVRAAFAQDIELDALIGSYDDAPAAVNFMSQYRNLMHSFTHQNANRDAVTFWTGCGAVRRETFLEAGGFNEVYQTPAIEDIELGYRMVQAGKRMALDPELRVKHLKRWSVRDTLKTDFFYRALPWSSLIIRSGYMPNDLNLRISQRISVALAFVLLVMGGYVAVRNGASFLIALFVTFFLVLSYYWLECSHKRHRLIMGLMTGILALIAFLSYLVHAVMIVPLVLVCWLALFTRHRYATPFTRWHRRSGMLVGAYALLVVGFSWFYLPQHPLGTLFVFLLLVMVAVNNQFYLFLAGAKGSFFALAAIPFHLLYFLSSGLAFLCAAVNHVVALPPVAQPLSSAAETRSPDAEPCSPDETPVLALPEDNLTRGLAFVCAVSAIFYLITSETVQALAGLTLAYLGL